MLKVMTIEEINEKRRGRVRDQLAVALNALGDARDVLELMGGHERSDRLHKMILDVGTMMNSA